MILPSGKNPSDITDEDIVRLSVSFDFGWSKRGNGRQYDSKNGYGAIIGYFTGKVLDVRTMNVDCVSCNKGIPKDQLDCRQNFEGTSKAMEAEAARSLVVKNKLLEKYNVQIGIYAADNDSTGIHAITSEIEHPIIKVDDTNHTKKGVMNQLYKVTNIEDPLKELSKNGKDYLRRCFSYALEQNKGDAPGLAKTLTNIPYHAHNIHDNCGEWCRYKSDKENYNHSSIPGGFQSPELFEALKRIFDQLAKHADRFSSAASSQANESLINSIARKCPKNICYCMSESADNRVHCAVCQKNLSFFYTENILEFLGIDPGINLEKRNKVCSAILKKKVERSKKPEIKLRRRQNKIKKKRVSKKKVLTEIHTYKSNVTLNLNLGNIIEENRAENALKTISMFQSESFKFPAKESSNLVPALVYFDLEASGFGYRAEILQVAFRCDTSTCMSYVKHR